MKKVYKGRVYDTETSRKLHTWTRKTWMTPHKLLPHLARQIPRGESGLEVDVEVEAYKTKKGRYFLIKRGEFRGSPDLWVHTENGMCDELLNAGLSVDQLTNIGFTLEQA